jgi:hypothetical protein
MQRKSLFQLLLKIVLHCSRKGVNHNEYKAELNVFSNALCTINCLAPLAKVRLQFSISMQEFPSIKNSIKQFHGIIMNGNTLKKCLICKAYSESSKIMITSFLKYKTYKI